MKNIWFTNMNVPSYYIQSWLMLICTLCLVRILMFIWIYINIDTNVDMDIDTTMTIYINIHLTNSKKILKIWTIWNLWGIGLLPINKNNAHIKLTYYSQTLFCPQLVKFLLCTWRFKKDNSILIFNECVIFNCNSFL